MSIVRTGAGFASMVVCLVVASGCELDNSREITTNTSASTDSGGSSGSGGNGGSDNAGGNGGSGGSDANTTRATSANNTDGSNGGSNSGGDGGASTADSGGSGSGGTTNGGGGEGGDAETASTSTTGSTDCQDGGDDPEHACVVEDLTTPYRKTSAVDPGGDDRDLYKITMLENGILTYGLDDITGRAQVKLYEDKNPFNIATPYDFRVDSSAQQLITLVLEKGTYVIAVLPVTTNALTTFLVSAEYYKPEQPEDEPGKEADAFQVQALTEPRIYGGYVGGTDDVDDYLVSLTDDGILGIQLNNVVGDVQVQLLAKTSVPDWNSPIDQSLRAYGGTADPAPLEKPLSSGDYYVRIRPYNNNGTNSLYKLSFYDAEAP